MAKFKTADPVVADSPIAAAAAPAPQAEIPVSTETTADAGNAAGAPVDASAAAPAKRGRGGKRGPRADHGPTFPWSQPIEETVDAQQAPLTLQNALIVVAAGIVSGNVRGGLTLGALQSAFTAAIAEGHIELGDETFPLEVSAEDLALLTPVEVKKAYNAYAKATAKNDGVEMPELVVARRAKINTSRLAGLFKPLPVATV